MTSKLTREERVQALCDLKVGQVLSLADIENVKMLSRMALAAMDSEPVAYADPRAFENFESGSARREWMWKNPGEDLVPLYRHAQPVPVVDADDNFYSWFGREWAENYQHNQYTTAAKQMLGVMAESAWKAGRRAAMLQAGNSPVIPDGYVMVPVEPTNEILDEFDSIIDYGAEDSVDAWHRLLAAAPQPPGSEPAKDDRDHQLCRRCNDGIRGGCSSCAYNVR